MAKDRKIDLVILGLLFHEDLTGYDIKKRIDGAISFFWKGSFGSIYPALADMEKTGQVEKLEVETKGKREKILYHITDKGIDVLKEWLNVDQATNDLKYETLLKLYFGGVEGKEVTLKNISLFEEQVKRDLAVLQMFQKNLEMVLDQKDHVYYYLTVTFGIDTYEAYLKWCERAKKILCKKKYK
ncbi:MAG: PadR family transcriptional regulator [Lachnospiraceae bacterium]|nr:PadR family transcriptional regulator [Lachnospiraceae bacterium]